MPSVYFGIAGGYKVIFDYANYLIDNNYEVFCYFDTQNGKNTHHIPSTICHFIRAIFLRKYYKMYNINKKICLIPIRLLSPKFIKKSDIIIATSPNITFFVNSLDKTYGKKIEFVQGYETWSGESDSYVKKSYSLMENITVSKWLKELVDNYSKKDSYLVPNGIDTNIFSAKVEISHRNPHSICMIYNNGDNKGCKYAVEAIINIKKEYPETKVEFSGTPRRPKNLPRWIKYNYRASEKEIINMYNNNAIFICSSIVEGFGLPGLEAMSCGCSLITTNCYGPMDYCDNSNAIICESKNTDAIYSSIKILFDNNEKRIKMAKKGMKDAQKYSIIKSRKLFLECINE